MTTKIIYTSYIYLGKNRSNTCCKYPMKRNKMIGIHHWNYNCIYSITSVMQNFSKKKKDPWYSYSKMLNNLNVTPYIKKSWYYKSSWLLVVSEGVDSTVFNQKHELLSFLCGWITCGICIWYVCMCLINHNIDLLYVLSSYTVE